ncbi:MAG: glycosyltransferase, partial [Candidatus Omnitrophota bacterium]
RRRFQPEVIVCEDGPQFENIRKQGIRLIRLKVKPSELESFLRLLPNILGLRNIIKKGRIDLLHINTNIISGLPAILAAKISGIPCVCHLRQTRALIKRERFFAKWVDKFIVTNEKARKTYARDIPADELVLIYNGIDVEKFGNEKTVEDRKLRMELGVKDNEAVVGMVGRIVEGKGHTEFIKAAAIVKTMNPKTKFLVVGGYPTPNRELEQQLMSLAYQLNLNGNLRFIGWRDDIKSITGVFDIAVQLSTKPEGFGLTCIEAMALNKPVIATNIPGPSEIVVDGVTGFLVPPGNPQAIAEKIEYLLEHPDVAQEMGKAGRKRVEERFNIKETVRKIEKVYEEIINANSH